MKAYVVVLDCAEGKIKTRAKEFQLTAGIYCYVGSCGMRCSKRISRHLVTEKRRKFWHIDFTDELCEPILALVIDEEEKELAMELSFLPGVKGFGNSDDRGSSTHLFKVPSIRDLLKVILKEHG